MDFQSMSLSFP